MLSTNTTLAFKLLTKYLEVVRLVISSLCFQFYPGAGHKLDTSAVASHFHGNVESFFSSCVGTQSLLSPLGAPYTQSDVRDQDKADGWI